MFTINQIKCILQIHEQTITNFFNSTLEQMDKKISALIGENAVLKNEVVVELTKSLQFQTDQWEESFKTLDSLKNELLQKKKTSYTRLNKKSKTS